MSLFEWVMRNLLPEPIYPEYIDAGVLEDCLNAAQGTHPNEFLALLVAEHSSEIEFTRPETAPEDAYVITSYYVIPGTKASPSSASIKQINVPVTGNVVGSFHSHPNGTLRPSTEDSNMFRKYPVNIITGHPYSEESWVVYDSSSQKRDITLIETEERELDDIWFEGIEE